MVKRALAGATAAIAALMMVPGTSQAVTTGSAALASRPAPARAGAPRMPLAPYWVPDATVDQISRALASLRLGCMRQLGFSQLPVAFATVLPATWHPILAPLSARDAARDGYASLASAPQAEEVTGAPHVALGNRAATAAETAAMNGYRHSVHGHAIPPGGCWQQAERELQAGVGGLGADPRAVAFLGELTAQSDPQVTAVFTRWSACMRRAGFGYQTPFDAVRDPRWASTSATGTSYPAHATQAETATAVADASCRQRVNLNAVWQAAQARYQRQVIATERGRLSRARSVIRGWLANARRLGAQASAAAVPVPATPGSEWNGPYSYALPGESSPFGYLTNSCYCSYNGDPLKIFQNFYSGPGDWWVSDPLSEGYRIMASAEGTPTIWAVSDHDLSTKRGAGIYIWKVGSSVLENQQVYIGAAPGYPAGFYYIRNRFSGLYVSQSTTNNYSVAWENWGYEAPEYGTQVWY